MPESIHVRQFIVSCLLICGSAIRVFSQENDTASKNFVRSTIIRSGVLIGIHAGGAVALYSLWYRQYPLAPFHFFNDWQLWLQMDKAGHAYSGYWLTVAYSHYLRDSTRWWLPPAFAALSLLSIEVMDGFSAKWGFSWGDMVANITGILLAVPSYMVFTSPFTKRIPVLLKFGWKPISYPAEAKPCTDKLFGAALPTRLLKDYNAQSYWLAFPLPFRSAPDWFLIAIGYSAENMFGGLYNNCTSLPRLREFFLSFDINWWYFAKRNNNLPELVKYLLLVFNALRIPFPALSMVYYDGSLIPYVRLFGW